VGTVVEVVVLSNLSVGTVVEAVVLSNLSVDTVVETVVLSNQCFATVVEAVEVVLVLPPVVEKSEPQWEQLASSILPARQKTMAGLEVYSACLEAMHFPSCLLYLDDLQKFLELAVLKESDTSLWAHHIFWYDLFEALCNTSKRNLSGY
jgi:hypothetical protein